jgi:asparagine synthase (glutamine-hydrolysing)
MANRGPDAEGQWFGPSCALGHRRLAIVDLRPEAGQPMRIEQYLLIFNGEIYNFTRLRSELERLGHRFSTHSDTEVILIGWIQWGVDVLSRLEGMFAFALWDTVSETLFLARDRMGKKPLVYTSDGNGLVFASDVRALEDVSGQSRGIDESSLRRYFALRWIPEPATILQRVNKLPPGHVLSFTRGRIEVKPWVVASPRLHFNSREEASQELLQRLDAAVIDRMVADVPVGIFLSGGIDSAAVAASATARGVRPRTFTVSFPGASTLDEGPAAAAVARHLRTDHHEIHLSGKEVSQGLFAALDGMDEPFADASSLPTYMLCRAVRGQATVLLSGDGGDEVLGGYRKYIAERLMTGWSAVPRPLTSAAAMLMRSVAAVGPAEIRRRLLRFLAQTDRTLTARQIGWARQFSDAELQELFIREAPYEDLNALHEAARPDDCDPITALLRTDQGFSLLGQMLVKVDRMSMAASVEVRSPFLDSRVVSAANSMPGEWKVGLRRGKLILRRALAERLPPSVFALGKRGFDPPLVQWLLGDLAELLDWVSQPRELSRQGIFRPEIVLSWRQRLATGDALAASKLWTFACFQYWASKRGLYGTA